MMKFEIAMKEMKDVIKKIEKSIPKSPSLSILETILVKQENNQLAFIATNCDRYDILFTFRFFCNTVL